MITFLNTIIFTGSAAILIPLVIHLLNRQKKRYQQFSSIRFIKLIDKKRLKRLNIYQYLLIILRTLIILSLLLAFARPTIIGNANIWDNTARSSAVIILDTGINMQYVEDEGIHFDRALRKLGEIFKQFKSEDQVYLMLSHNGEFIRMDSVRHGELYCTYETNNWHNLIM